MRVRLGVSSALAGALFLIQPAIGQPLVRSSLSPAAPTSRAALRRRPHRPRLRHPAVQLLEQQRGGTVYAEASAQGRFSVGVASQCDELP
jgi:hypothetical protein